MRGSAPQGPQEGLQARLGLVRARIGIRTRVPPFALKLALRLARA